jgi:hypothetical protein
VVCLQREPRIKGTFPPHPYLEPRLILSFLEVPALWYDAPKDADPSAPPKGAFILPESGLIVDFVASLYPSIQFESFTLTHLPGKLTTHQSMIPSSEPRQRSWYSFARMSPRPGFNTASFPTMGKAGNWTISSRLFESSSVVSLRDMSRVRNMELRI